MAFDGRFEVPTFDEILELARSVNERRAGSRIGVYPETKHPAHFRGIGLPLEAPLLAALARHGYDDPAAPVFIQSFDPNNLRLLRGMTNLPLVQLRENRVGDLPDIADYSDAIGIDKVLADEACVSKAHELGLKVHVWTLRAENLFLPPDLRRGGGDAAHGDLAAEIERYLRRGVDGFFTDFPATGVRVRDAFAKGVAGHYQS
jgi:glycerophosphoryl diester phosphodiesterase